MQKSIVAIGLLLGVGAATASSNAKVAPTVGTKGIGLHYPYNPRSYMLKDIIKLLTEMEAERSAEESQDKIMYQNQQCWCTETRKEAILMRDTAQTDKEAAEAADAAAQATRQRLQTEILVLDGKIEKGEEQLAELTKVREDENAVFVFQEKNLLNAVATIRKAMEYLEKVLGGGSNEARAASLETNFLQKDRTTFQENMRSVLEMVHVAPEHASTIAAFVQNTNSQMPWPGKGYTVQTGGVMNALKSVLESSQTQLAALRAVESLAKEKYDTAKAAFDGMIDEWKKIKAEKQVAAATAGTNAAQNSLASSAAKNTEGFYDDFIKNLDIKCALWDEQYAYRTKNRADELAGIQNALAILVDIKSHEVSVKAFNPLSFHTVHPYVIKQTSFLQTSSHAVSRQTRAAAVLENAAKVRANSKLHALALKVAKGSDAATAIAHVRASLATMIEDLKAEQEEETAHVQFCHAEINSNSLATLTKTNELSDINVMKVNHGRTMSDADDEITKMTVENKEAQALLDSSTSLRGKESAEFAIMKKDMTEMIEILTSAMTALTRFYGNYKDSYQTLEDKAQQYHYETDPTTQEQVKVIDKEGYDEEFMQDMSGSKKQPIGVKRYSPSKRAGGAISLLGSIAKKCEANLRELTSDERRAGDTFVKLKAKITAQIVANNAAIEQSEAIKAAAADNKAIAERAAGDIQMELNQLGNYKADLDSSCAWYIKNYATRQNARSLEIWGLMQASNILGGAAGASTDLPTTPR